MASPALSRDRIPAVSIQDTRTDPAAPRDLRPTAPVIHRIAARYRYDLRRAAWWWSPEMFALQGLPEAGQEASTQLLLQPRHPEDRAGALRAITAASTEGRPFNMRSRL